MRKSKIDLRKLFLFIILIIGYNVTEAAQCRNPKIKHQFDLEQGYPKGRKGYIVDHICSLKCGGLDITKNMQYQTIEESKKKDTWENTKLGCAYTCNASNSLNIRTVFNCKK
jgi:hypothetical protein